MTIVGDSMVVDLVASVVVACVIMAGTVVVVIFIGDAEVAVDVEQAAVNPCLCRSVVIFGVVGNNMMVDLVADGVAEVAVGTDCSRSTSSALFPFVASPSSLRLALIWTTVSASMPSFFFLSFFGLGAASFSFTGFFDFLSSIIFPFAIWMFFKLLSFWGHIQSLLSQCPLIPQCLQVMAG